MKIHYLKILILIYTVLFFVSCTKFKTEPNYQGYPEEIGKIILTKCAVTGCHNDVSKEAASGLSLSTWDKLFEGDRNNAAIVPYRTDQSFLMFFINTDTTLGITLTPVMPFDGSPLSEEEVTTIRNWIKEGAPDKNGFVKFSDNPDRPKLYVINSSTDMVFAIDLETKLIMRAIDVGSFPSFYEIPHRIEVSPDGQSWYVCFIGEGGSTFEKYRASDDTFVGRADLEQGAWSTMAFTSDSKKAFVINYSPASIAYIDLENMTLLAQYKGADLLSYPHGCALKNDSTLYVTALLSNYFYKIDVSDPFNPVFDTIVLQTGDIPEFSIDYLPHDIRFSPDKSEYVVTCQEFHVRFFNAENDSLIAFIQTGKSTHQAEFSNTTDYLFVTCGDDDVSFPGKVGSVYVINYKTHAVVKTVFTGFQPHGIIIDDVNKLVFVANRNVNPDGPAPHHPTGGGRNGYLTIIDLNTLELLPDYKAELSVEPYYIAIRH